MNGFNEQKNGGSSYLVSVSVDGSYEDQGKHKAVKSLVPLNNPTVDLTATSNSDHKSVHTNDDQEDNLLTWNLITNDGEENYEKKSN